MSLRVFAFASTGICEIAAPFDLFVIPIEIAGVRAVLAPQGSGRPYYHVGVQRKSGRRRHVATYIRSKREAEWVAARIRKQV